MVDDKGDRDPDYWMWDLQPGWSKFQHVLEIQMTNWTSTSQVTNIFIFLKTYSDVNVSPLFYDFIYTF